MEYFPSFAVPYLHIGQVGENGVGRHGVFPLWEEVLPPVLGLHSGDTVRYTISDRPALSMVMEMETFFVVRKSELLCLKAFDYSGQFRQT